MLTVAKVTAGQAQGYAAYLDGRTQAHELGDYYLKDGDRIEAPGRWATGAQLVGADPTAAVHADALHALMAVRHPQTGLPLRRVGGNGQAVCAIDATFSAPKSVSAVWALGSPELREQVEQAHEHAVDRALAYALQWVPMIRRRTGPDQVTHTTAAGLIATSWRHTTARAVQGQPPDPQLHSHVLLHGAVRSDGEIVAIDSRSWYVHRRELGAAYRTQLAHGLSRLGFEIQRGTGRGGRYFEIAGIPAGLIDHWSSRHHQVQLAIEARLADKHAALQATIAAGGPGARDAAAALERLQRSGRLMPAEERYMATHTRSAKDTLQTHGDQDQRWYQAARDFGVDSLRVEALRAAERPPKAVSSRELAERLTEFDSTFAERQARAVALEASAGADVDQALLGLARLRARGELLALKDGRYTTAPHRAAERHTTDTAARLAKSRAAPLPAELTSREALALDTELKAHGAGLSAEQRQALLLGCSDRQLVIIEGQAGTGKSTTLTAIARAHQADGRQLIVTSTAALAAQHLAAELEHAGVTATPHSTASLHAALTTGKLALTPATTVIHDEAALASTREQQRLLDAVEAAGARVILVGDPRQNQAVGAGGLWPYLEQHARDNGAHARLTAIVRAQNPADRRDQTLFRAGQHQRALHGYQERGRVHLAADQRLAEDAALDAAHADRRAGKRALVIAQTSNEHLDQLNARAQAIRAQHGEHGEHGLQLTGRPYRLHAGDQVQLRRALEHPDLGRLANGTTATITDVHAAGRHATLRLPDGRQARLTRAQADQASVRLAYVQHPFSAQGQTTDTTHLIVAEHATQEGSYVALTRARQATHIHAPHPHHALEQLQLDQPEDQDPLAVLAEQMGRSEPELASIRSPLAQEQQVTRQLDTAHQPTREPQHTSQPDRDKQRRRDQDRERELAERLGQARAELHHAQGVVDSYPADHAREHRAALQAAARAEQSLKDRERRAELLTQRLDQLGPSARHGQSGRQLKDQYAQNDRLIARLVADHQQASRDAEQHQAIIDRWEREHPDADRRLSDAQHAYDQLLDQQAQQRIQQLQKTLGPRPRRQHTERDAAQDPQPDERDRQLAERLQQARAQADEARRLLESYPAGHERAHQHALQAAERADQQHAHRLKLAVQHRSQLGNLGPLARHGQQAQDLKRYIAVSDRIAAEHQQTHQRLLDEAGQHRAIVDDWNARHPDASDRLKVAERVVDQLIDEQAQHRVGHPGPHLTRTLGPAPNPLSRDHQTWQHAALQIERYRARYQIDPAEPTALGHEPEWTERQQLEDREQAAIIALRARTNLGQRSHAHDPIEQIHHTPHLGRQPPGLEHGHGLHL